MRKKDRQKVEELLSDIKKFASDMVDMPEADRAWAAGCDIPHAISEISSYLVPWHEIAWAKFMNLLHFISDDEGDGITF